MRFIVAKHKPAIPCEWYVADPQARYRVQTQAFKVQGDGKIFMPSSWNVMCQQCGHIWAKRTVQSSKLWWVKYITCAHCADPSNPQPVSLWSDYSAEWNQSLGRKLLVREVKLEVRKRR